MILKKGVIILIFIILTMGISFAEPTIKRGTDMVGFHLTSYSEDNVSVMLWGVNFEHFFNRLVSINSDILMAGLIVPNPSLELGLHLFPFHRRSNKTEGFEILAGGGGILSLGGESNGIYPTCYGGFRYHLTDKIGVFASCRWIFGEFDAEAGIPFISVGISYVKKKKKSKKIS